MFSNTIFVLDLFNLIFISNAAFTIYLHPDEFDTQVRLMSALVRIGTLTNIIFGMHFMFSGVEHLALVKSAHQFISSFKGMQDQELKRKS